MEKQNLSRSIRHEWIDLVKGICMFFIIAVHNNYVPLYFSIFINSFFIVAYFILAGYLFHNLQNQFYYRKKICRITESILIPYLIYWILSFTLESLIKGNFYFFTRSP